MVDDRGMFYRMEKIEEFEGGLIIKSESLVSSYQSMIENGLQYLGLPVKDVFADCDQRFRVYKNIEDVLGSLNPDDKGNSYYISKFFAAVSCGLFDAALNFLWDETILQLRKRVINYDIEYFFDCAVSGEKREKFKSVDDLVKVSDGDLLKGCKEIGLISDIGYEQLINIKFMRNWASSAHPNNVELSGLQLITWLETCIKEVVLLPNPQNMITINKLLKNIKVNKLSSSEVEKVSVFLIELSKEQANSLMKGIFGIYTRVDTTEFTRNNIRMMCKRLWNIIDEETKNGISIAYSQFTANAETEKASLTKSFLQTCEAIHYITDDLRVAEINELIISLKSVHENYNNFYNEHFIAKQLNNIAGNKVPNICKDKFVSVIVDVFLTNGNGVASLANDIYLDVISKFDNDLAMRSILSISNSDIVMKLKRPLCKNKFLELLNLLQIKISSPLILELIDMLRNSKDIYITCSSPKFKEQIETILSTLKMN